MQYSLPEVYFLHIPKTAGSSLAGLIRRFYPEEDAIPVFEWAELVKMKREEINRYRCYTGHFGTGLYSLLDRPVPTVTLLRDPFERSVSQIKHAAKFDAPKPTMLPGKPLTNLRTLYDHATKSPLELWLGPHYTPIGVEDYQTRQLGVDLDINPLMGKPDKREFSLLVREAGKGEDMDKVFERAKRRLDSMAVVGTVERFAESVELICDHLGVPAPETIPEDNIAQGRSLRVSHRDSGKISARTIADIDAITMYDRRLYEYASQLLDARLKQRSHLDKKRKEALLL